MANPLLRGSLRALSAFAGSELVERYGLHEPAQRWLSLGTKRAAEMLKRAAERARSDAERAPTSPAERFDLTPTEDQELVRSTMRRFADEAMRPAAAAADDALEPPRELLAQAADLGLYALAVPEAHGGAAQERSPTTWALVAEELARGDMGLAVALMAPVAAASLLSDFATPAQKEKHLAPLAGDDFVAAVPALLERRPLFDPRALATRAKRVGVGYRLRGEKALVPLGRAASFFLVSAKLDDAPRLFLVERDRPGVEVRSEPAMGLRGADLCTLRLDGVEVPSDARIGDDGFDHQRLIDLARIGWGALAVGQARAMLEYVIEYGNDRVAFGEPITNRQSVAFLIADIAIELEGLRLMTWRAAARAERGLPFTREAHLVRVQAARYAAKIGTDGVQVLGGAGFVREHPVERWYRHLRAVGVMEGAVSV